ncbi:FAD-dependent oxidoreductase [Endozoicomonas numazuensis]|uniref:2-octaprenyl-3-methyl-6-methoxy-1,4-benzoquinol hydroxylase n=1 Tax=Endozoicomonas numazuensis TaxID=1137799 RepID=A0A081NLM3_9GAMM|nr:FAD-dependent oxidoreductase [Endozoicomonas numazuensis]KEQ19346.1 2-octaprenyl-3-methyl-6-methoxy-1,4-benzoquinol hydroxylase [Endozoicomonas numazuensis]
MKSFDLVIVGGGMVGASLALSLAEKDLKIALIDQQSLTAQAFAPDSIYAPRVSALTEASSRLFQQLGAWEYMTSQRVMPYQNMYVWDGEGTGEIEFDASSAGFKTLGHIVENDVIRNALLQKLAETDIECFPGQSTIDYQLGEPHQVQLESEQIEARLLVATDGAESPLRRLSGIPSSQKDYLHHAVVTTVETERYHQDTAWQVFLDTGPLAFLPMPSRGNKHYCSIVWSLIPNRADEVLLLDDEAFCRAIQLAFESRLGAVISADPRFRFPLKQRHARHYHRNRIVLAGDAAHTIHPLAGQGVNLGLQDVEALSEEIIRAVDRGDDFSASHILNRYERRRMGSNLLMMKSMEGLQNLFAADDIGIRWLRNAGLKWTNRLPFAKDVLIKHAMGL